jgi:geranylgeranyl diphosphate synthase type II
VKDADLLYQFGKDIGIAFQLQDDWLDVFGDHQKVGKQVGGDIIAGKKTVLFFKAMELANSEEKATLLNTMQATTIDDASRVNTVKALYDKLEVGRLVKEEMDVHFNNAMKNLKACSAAEEKQALLHDLAVTLMSREA